jgi:hypothetical protein
MITLDDSSETTVTPDQVNQILVAVIRRQIAETVAAAVARAINAVRGRVD